MTDPHLPAVFHFAVDGAVNLPYYVFIYFFPLRPQYGSEVFFWAPRVLDGAKTISFFEDFRTSQKILFIQYCIDIEVRSVRRNLTLQI